MYACVSNVGRVSLKSSYDSCYILISASLSGYRVERKRYWCRPVAYPICRSVGLCVSVCVSVRKVYCGKTADWIRMPFGVVSGIIRGVGVLDGVAIVEGKRQSCG